MRGEQAEKAIPINENERLILVRKCLILMFKMFLYFFHLYSAWNMMIFFHLSSFTQIWGVERAVLTLATPLHFTFHSYLPIKGITTTQNHCIFIGVWWCFKVAISIGSKRPRRAKSEYKIKRP